MAAKDGPLIALARRLSLMGMPSLNTLVTRFDEAEEYREFRRILREFLPEREAEILHETTPDEQIRVFSDRFADRYFPLETGLQESYGDFVRGIPVEVMGLSYDDYHQSSLNWRPGLQLMTLVCQGGYDDEGTKVAQAEACLKHIPVELIRQSPDSGLPAAEVHRIFDNTSHKALGAWADILNFSTGNFFLDTDYETLWEGGFPEWDRDTVEFLTQQWREHEALYRGVINLAAWIEEEPAARFAELIRITNES